MTSSSCSLAQTDGALRHDIKEALKTTSTVRETGVTVLREFPYLLRMLLKEILRESRLDADRLHRAEPYRERDRKFGTEKS